MNPNTLATLTLVPFLATARASDVLPSWNDGPARQAIVSFVARVTREGSPDFVPMAERIAAFDNDGTLCPERPTFYQLMFAIDRVNVLAPKHPEWRDKEPFASVLKGDALGALVGNARAIAEVEMATQAGMTTAEFEQGARSWLATAQHPKFKRLCTECAYQPMLELLAYLRVHGFKTFLVSGGDVEFMRAWTEKAYGIPPEQVIGSTRKTRFTTRDGQPVLVEQPELSFDANNAGKVVGIHAHIGRRPVAAFGNSDGDREMLEWTQAGKGPRLIMLLCHDDPKREFAYSYLSAAFMAEAERNGWPLISMKNDWKCVFPPEKQ